MPEISPQMLSLPTVLSSWTQVLVRALRGLGVDPEPLMVDAGLELSLLQQPNYRLPQEVSTRFWQLAARATDDESLGIWVSKFSSHTTFHALGYAFMASRSLGEALSRVVRYQGMISGAATITFEQRNDVSRLGWVLQADMPQPAEEAIEAIMASIIRAGRRLSGPEFAPVKVQLHRPKPNNPVPFAEFFRCPVEFNQGFYCLTFDNQLLEQPLLDANEMLAQFNDRLVEEYLAQAVASSLTSKLRSLLVKELPSGKCAAEKYADLLGMSGRSLQRKLSAEGTSFNQVLNDTRLELARVYLSKPQSHTLTDIAFLLGFSDTSSFSRAFHRWTGVSPSAYRAGLCE